jgi:hypothetical protein
MCQLAWLQAGLELLTPEHKLRMVQASSAVTYVTHPLICAVD